MAINNRISRGGKSSKDSYYKKVQSLSMNGKKSIFNSTVAVEKSKKEDTVAYVIDGNVYINLTNECSNDCEFCVRNGKDTYCDYSLWLSKNPTASEVIEALDKYIHADYESYVFCGFGEPLYAYDVMMEVADYLKENGKLVRLNTNGQADLIIGKSVDEIAESFIGKIDVVSISLNAPTKEAYQAICRSKFGLEAFNSILRFAAACTTKGINTVMSVVDVIGESAVARCADIAKVLGAQFRCRELIE